MRRDWLESRLDRIDGNGEKETVGPPLAGPALLRGVCVAWKWTGDEDKVLSGVVNPCSVAERLEVVAKGGSVAESGEEGPKAMAGLCELMKL